jgi:hypothetical protein
MELFDICKYILYFFVGLFLFIIWMHYCFVPFYKGILREKIRECIIQCRLDKSGRQIQRNMVEPEKLLQILQTIEKLFGLDDKPLITTKTPTKCIFNS